MLNGMYDMGGRLFNSWIASYPIGVTAEMLSLSGTVLSINIDVSIRVKQKVYQRFRPLVKEFEEDVLLLQT
jgi:hypothetical protein